MKYLSNFNKIVLLILVLLVFILSTFFHFPVQIVDALTLEASPDFDIHISIWRILFEPVMGLLLFFNRSTFAIEENELLLFWVLLFFIFFSIVKIIKIKDHSKRKKQIITKLADLPLVIGLWFTFFLVLIFLSRFFPANTIVNNSKNSILVTTHSHTDFSHDGLVSEEDLWKWHRRNNFDAFFITDHNNHTQTIDFVKLQRDGEFPAEPLVMCGEEFSGSNHLSLLGLQRKFDTHGYSDQQVVDSVKANGGAVLVNHWFDGEKKTLEYFKNLGVDGFEIENTATDRTYNRSVYQKIKEFCETNKLIMNGGLDYHGYGNVCSIWNAMEIPDWNEKNQVEKEKAILNVIKLRDQSKLKVLLYKDRPYYTADYLIFRPVITFLNYFRTLNLSQMISWLFWIVFFAFLKVRISGNQRLKDLFSFNKLISVAGIFSAVFMLILGVIYSAKADELAGTENDVYANYKEILFYTGTVFLIYSVLTAYYRFKKR